MSQDFTKFSGPIILNAVLKGQAGKGDEIAKLLTAIHKNANSDAEPGCSTFRTARHNDDFVVFEKYDNPKAVNDHFASEQFNALANSGLLAAPPSLAYYEEFN